jgi:D-alanyl-D-alanine carboxypeptidase
LNFALTFLLSIAAFAQAGALATSYLVVDADSGQVLIDNQGTTPWYPASLTTLITVYVALDAVHSGRLTLDTPLIMSARAAQMPPSKMGFRPGTEVTLDNALKMLMVKSPNDVAGMIAEGVSGSVEAFADEMNAAAQRLGLHESHFVNPNGLHDPNHVSSARDMVIVALALLREFPDHADLFSIGALQLGNQIIQNDNGLLGRYPGADGMKTGFTCPAGFNVVASAKHGGRRLIVVVLGYPTARSRNQEAADLFDQGFAMSGGAGSLDALPSGSGVAPDPRSNVCLHRNAAALAAEEAGLAAPNQTVAAGAAGRGAPVNNPIAALFAPAHTLLSNERPHFDPVQVFIGPAPGWNGPALGPRPTGTAPPAVATLVPQVSEPGATIVPMVIDGGALAVPVTINSQLTLRFVVDSGASDVSIPADVVLTLVRTETITDADFLGKQTYKLADGSTVPSQRFVIRSLKVGDKVLENVTGSIAPIAGSLLLGQSFLGRFKSWSIDNERRALLLN